MSDPPVRERVYAIVVAHQRREEDCGDHSVERCLCGAPSLAESRMASFAERTAARHKFSWDEHFMQVWNSQVEPLLDQMTPYNPTGDMPALG